MAVHISPNRQVVSLTWRSAASYAWKNSRWFIRPLKAVTAFFQHVYMNKETMDQWANNHQSCRVAEDYKRALLERTIACSRETQTEEDTPPESSVESRPPSSGG